MDHTAYRQMIEAGQQMDYTAYRQIDRGRAGDGLYSIPAD
jgi:hypothetical protein